MSDDDLRARLRGADPAASLGPADPDAVTRLVEATVAQETLPETRESGLRGRSALTWALAAAACALILGVVTLALLRPWAGDGAAPVAEDAPTVDVTPTADDETVAPTVLQLPASVAARCAPPSADILGTFEVAFRGSVSSTEGGTVVLEPEEVYAGAVGDTVEIAAPEESLVDLIGAPRFEVGTSYLVAASGGEVAVCGYSGPATRALERLYARAFPR